MPAGRPPYYDNVEQLSEAIEKYFQELKGEWDSDRMAWKVEPKHPSITGLALALGFTTRQALINYEEKPEFVDTIKKAKLRVEAAYEQAIFSKNAAGPIFALKNFGWTDKQEIDQNTKISGSMTFTGIQIIRDYDHSATPGPEVQTPPDAEAGTMPPPSV